MAPSALDDEHAPLYTVGQVAEMLAVKQAFLRRVDDLRVVSPQRSAGGQRRGRPGGAGDPAGLRRGSRGHGAR